jgi:hypothetical protein
VHSLASIAFIYRKLKKVDARISGAAFLGRQRMIAEETKTNNYQALIDKKTEYEGIIYVGVQTTGMFCRPKRLRLRTKSR